MKKRLDISRLGLLMAGGGAKVRRLIAENGHQQSKELEQVLAGKLPGPLLDAARTAEESGWGRWNSHLRNGAGRGCSSP